MSSPAVTDAVNLLHEGFTALGAARETNADDSRILDIARAANRFQRSAEQHLVAAVAELDRRGFFTQHGLRTVTGVTDLLRVEPAHARRLVVAADTIIPRTNPQGQPLPARLPATAAAYTAGTASLTHVHVIAALLASAPAARLTPSVQTEVEQQLAAHTADYTPGQLRTWGQQLIELLDQDGPEPDDPEPEPVNALTLTPHTRGSGGSLRGRIEDPALYASIATMIDANARPRTGDDLRPLPQRQAEALADICGYVAAHGDRDIAPDTAGRRPQITVTVRLDDLQNRGRAACLDFAGIATPTALRLLCCDAWAIPHLLDYSPVHGHPGQGYRWSGPCRAGVRLLRAAVVEPVNPRVGED